MLSLVDTAPPLVDFYLRVLLAVDEIVGTNTKVCSEPLTCLHRPLVPRRSFCVPTAWSQSGQLTAPQVVDRDFRRTSEEQQRNSQIKDTMRDSAMEDIAASWHRILEANGRGDPHICVMCLDVIRAFVDWNDICLVVNDVIMPYIVGFLNRDPARREGACDVLRAIITKGMDLETKATLIANLGLIEIVQRYLTQLASPDALRFAAVARLLTAPSSV